MRLTFVLITLFVAVCSQPISLQELAGRIQVSELSSSDELASAALAWSLSQTPTERVCDYAKDMAPSYAVARAVSLAKCENIHVDVSKQPEKLKDLYDAIMAKPESKYFKPLLAMISGASHLDKLTILHAGAFLAVNNPDLKETTECKQLVSLFNQLIKSLSKDLLRLGDDLASPLQKASYLGSATCYLGSLNLVKPKAGALQMLAEIIASQSYARSIEDIAAIIELADCLARYAAYIPVIPDVVNKKDGLLSLKITDIFGRPVEVDSVTIISCKSSQGKSLFLVKQSVSDGVYQFKFDLKSSDPGIYRPVIKIASQGHEVLYDSLNMALTAYGVVELSQFKTWTSSKHEDSISSITASYPNESEDLLEITFPSTHLHVAFKLSSNLDDVAYIGVALINLDTNKHVVLTPTKRASGNYQLKLKYTHSTFSSRVPGNGRYQIKLLVSDPNLPEYIEWNVCKANVKLARIPGAVRLASDFVHMKNPDILHIFRPSESRCHALLSFVFTAIVAIPLIMLIPLWKSIGLRVSAPGTWGFFFHANLAAVFIVLTVYWVKMTLFDLAKWLIILAPFTIVIGNRALRSRRESTKSKLD